MNFAPAQHIADAVLYEGYILYPYRASAVKNQVRWQFGVVVPRDYSEAGGTEPWVMQTECLVEPGVASRFALRVRFLQMQARIIQRLVDPQRQTFRNVQMLTVGNQRLVTWDEGVTQEIDHWNIPLTEILAAEQARSLAVSGGQEVSPVQGTSGETVGRIVRVRDPLAGTVRIAATSRGSLVKMRVRIENLSPWVHHNKEGRIHALRRSLIATHLLLAVTDGAFVSLLDPPAWAQQAAASCENLHTWPVLVGQPGQRDLLLSSPIILYDYPQIAPESPADLCDATEIDELLTLRTMTLTDDERQEARGTDPRAAAILDRLDTMPPEILERLHGAVRSLRATTPAPEDQPSLPPWWDPSSDGAVSPGTDSIEIAGVSVSKGHRVRLRPGQRRADAQDMFLVGRLATVAGVFHDVDGRSYLAVTLVDDPAADIYQWHGRYLYFSPDEIEPLEDPP